MQSPLISIFGLCVIVMTVGMTMMTTVYGFSVGVPPTPTICRSMTPGHHGEKSQGDPPFCTVTSSAVSVKGGESVEVSINPINPDHSFKGFYIQAREIKSKNPIGTFSPHSDVKVHSCGGIKGNAAHHSNSTAKKSVTISWKAPSKYSGMVIFTATCVQDFFKFWTQVKSSPVEIQA